MFKNNLKKINDSTYFYKETSGVSLAMNFSFVIDTSKINELKGQILIDYLCTINSKYKTIKEIYDKKSELYSCKLRIHSTTYSKNTYIYFDYIMLDYKVVKDDYLDNAIEFASDILFKPYFVNGKLDKTRFNIIKEDIYNDYINSIKDFEYDSNIRYDKTVLNGYSHNLLIYDTKEELRKDLDSITDKDIIDFYYMLLDNYYKTILFGNYSKKDIDKILSKFNFKNTKKYLIDKNENIHLLPGYNEYTSKEYTQSVLYFTYNHKNFKKYATQWYAQVIGNIVNGMDGFLYEKLRTKYGVEYYHISYLIRNSNVFMIAAYIDKKNKDKTIEAIREFFKDVTNRKKIEKRLKYVKEKIKENIYLSNERPISIYYSVCNMIYGDKLSDRAFIKKVNEITVDDILDFFKNLENENIFFYIGDKHE